MQILYITGSCLNKNTSANMSHNGYIQGLLENGAEVDIIMANDSWGEIDNKLPRWENATYYEYNSVSFSDKLKKTFKRFFPQATTNHNATIINNESIKSSQTKTTEKKTLRSIIKNTFYHIFKPHSIYPLDWTWIQNASKFKSKKTYDLVISNSSPAASHKLASILIEKKQIKHKRWVQIWEDPWFHDLYGGHSDCIKQEEDILLQKGEEIYYVSPLTLHYQKIYYQEWADKMHFIPLPFLQFEKGTFIEDKAISFGYFGDYYSHTRNLRPFYDALCNTNYQGYIYGDSNLGLTSTRTIEVSGRVTLDELEKIQHKTSVLVHLCNLRGGQIPGKIYHYSATEKPILFILDGTSEEREIIINFFSHYKRYHFCDNNKESILAAINNIGLNYNQYKGHVVDDFSPQKVISSILTS